MCERIHQLSVYSAGVVWDGDRADYTLMNHSRREPFQQRATLTGTKQGSAEAGVEGEPLFVHPQLSSASLKSLGDSTWPRKYLVTRQPPDNRQQRQGVLLGTAGASKRGQFLCCYIYRSGFSKGR